MTWPGTGAGPAGGTRSGYCVTSWCRRCRCVRTDGQRPRGIGDLEVVRAAVRAKQLERLVDTDAVTLGKNPLGLFDGDPALQRVLQLLTQRLVMLDRLQKLGFAGSRHSRPPRERCSQRRQVTERAKSPQPRGDHGR